MKFVAGLQLNVHLQCIDNKWLMCNVKTRNLTITTTATIVTKVILRRISNIIAKVFVDKNLEKDNINLKLGQNWLELMDVMTYEVFALFN